MEGTQVWSLVWEDAPVTRQLSWCATTMSLGSKAQAAQQEKPAPREAHTAQLEKALTPQWRPGTAETN